MIQTAESQFTTGFKHWEAECLKIQILGNLPGNNWLEKRDARDVNLPTTVPTFFIKLLHDMTCYVCLWVLIHAHPKFIYTHPF